MADSVIFKQGSQQSYDRLPSKLSNILYYCTDTQRVFKGDMEVTPQAIFREGSPDSTDLGVLSPSDYRGRVYIDTDNKMTYVSNGYAWVDLLETSVITESQITSLFS